VGKKRRRNVTPLWRCQRAPKRGTKTGSLKAAGERGPVKAGKKDEGGAQPPEKETEGPQKTSSTLGEGFKEEKKQGGGEKGGTGRISKEKNTGKGGGIGGGDGGRHRRE